MTRIFLAMIVLVFLSCKKELPENPDNNLPVDPQVAADTIIPCEDDLIPNYFETTVLLEGYSQFTVHSAIGISYFDEHEIEVSHGASSVKLYFKLGHLPESYQGKKIYLLKPNFGVSQTVAEMRIAVGSFNPISYYPIEEDSLFVDFQADSVVLSFCNLEVNHASSNSNFFISGKVVSSH